MKEEVFITCDVQDCHQRLSSAFDLLLFFLCSLIPTLTPPPNNANLDMYKEEDVGEGVWSAATLSSLARCS